MPSSAASSAARKPKPLKPTKVVAVRDESDEEDDFDVLGGVEAVAKPKKTAVAKGKAKGSTERAGSQLIDPEADTEPEEEDETAGESTEMARRLAALTKENARLKAERETFAKQFEALSTLKTTNAEAVYEKAKKAAELRASAQDDLIATLTKYNDKLQAKAGDMERELSAARKALIAPVLPVDPKEVRSLKEEIKRIGIELRDRDEKISTLQKEYEAEVSNSRRFLNASTTNVPSVREPVNNASAESDLDHRSLKLYEDLCDLSIVNVKIKNGANGEEVSFNCVQTVEGRSLNFKLRTFKELDPETSTYVSQVLYLPLGLAQERDADLLDRLGPFRKEFMVQRSQLGAFWDQMKGRISGQGKFDEVRVQQ